MCFWINIYVPQTYQNNYNIKKYIFLYLFIHSNPINMAQLIGLNVYQINSQEPIPLASVQKYDFPFAGILVRPMNGSTGIVLSNGVTVFSQIQLLATNSVYSVVETPAAIAALS